MLFAWKISVIIQVAQINLTEEKEEEGEGKKKENTSYYHLML